MKNIYDITVGYPDAIVSSEMEMLKNGCFPHAIHFDVKKYSENDLPQDESGLTNWINQIWREKEHRLVNFYKADIAHRKFLPCDEKNKWPVSTSVSC